VPLNKEQTAFMRELAALVEKYHVEIYGVANMDVGVISIMDKTTRDDIFFGDCLMERLEGIRNSTLEDAVQKEHCCRQ